MKTFLAASCTLLLCLCSDMARAEEPVTVRPLLDGDTTILGQKLEYPPDGELRIQSAIVTLQPGASTGEHLHPVPVFGYVLEGELTVHYPAGVQKTYSAGDAVLEAIDTWHSGTNRGTIPVRILVVNMGVASTPNSIPRK